VSPGTDTLRTMDAPRAESPASRYDELHAEAAEALGFAGNTLRGIRDRYRSAYLEELARWEGVRDDLAAHEHESGDSTNGDATATAAASAAELGAADLRLRMLRGDADRTRGDLALHETELSRLELAIRNIEGTWLFMERGDTSLIGSEELPSLPSELRMRIVEAQEAERARLAQEVHDGPAQALSNAIFQVEYIERVLDQDIRLARTELRFLRDLLRRELGSVRTFISQLRPPVLDELGLDGAITDAIGRVTALTGLAISADLAAPTERLSAAQQTVVLRVLQEALQNVRKHGAASAVTVASAIDGDEWVLTVRDDGRGFDVAAVAARGRRNFGLQFMRERAELIGARFEVHSRPDGGTLVRLAIPVGTEETS